MRKGIFYLLMIIILIAGCAEVTIIKYSPSCTFENKQKIENSVVVFAA